MSNFRFGAGMPRSDEVLPGVKVADWQPPEKLGAPLILGPLRHPCGIWVEQLLFTRFTIVRSCEPPPETAPDITDNSL